MTPKKSENETELSSMKTPKDILLDILKRLVERIQVRMNICHSIAAKESSSSSNTTQTVNYNSLILAIANLKYACSFK